MVVTQEFTAKIDKLEAAYHRLEQQNTKLIEQNRQLAKSSRRGSDDATAGMANWAKGLAQTAAGYLSVRSAIAMVSAEMKSQDEYRRQAAENAITVADAQIKALRNLGVVSDQERKRFTEGIQRLSAETKVGLQPLYLAASSGLSASGGNLQATMRALGAAARIAPESPDEMTAISGALLHMGKATGTQDAMQNLGFLLGVGQQAAVTETGKIAQNLAPGVIGVAGYGGTAGEAGAMIAALTQGMADPEGRKASTAAVALAAQMDKLVGKGSPVANLRFLQQNAEARQAFLEKASFEGKAQVPVEQLLGVAGRGDTTSQYFEQALGAIPSGDAAAAVAQSMIAGIQQPTEQGVARLKRIQETGRERLGGTTAGKLAAIGGAFTPEELEKTLKSSGVGYFRRWGAYGDYRAGIGKGMSAPEAYAHAIEGYVNQQESYYRIQHQQAPQQIVELRDVMVEALAEARRQTAALERSSGGGKAAQEQLTVGGE